MQKKFIARLNAVDIIIAVLFITAVFSIVWSITASGKKEKNEVFTVYAVCEDMPQSAVCRLMGGSDIYDTDAQRAIGSLLFAENKSGELRLTMEIGAQKTDSGIISGNTRLLIGKYMSIIINHCLLSIRIENIEGI